MTDKPKPRQQRQPWKTQKSSTRRSPNSSTSGIHNDDAGIFVTCDKGQEAKCLREVDDILSECVDSHQDDGPKGAIEAIQDGGDIEGSIAKELQTMELSSTNHKKAYTFVRLDIPCVSFIRTPAPLNPVSLVRRICEDASSNAGRPRSRYVRRLTPISCMRKTLGDGLEQLCKIVLRPAFGDGVVAKKFAIRPSIRNNDILHRDSIIKTVADAVSGFSSSHSVDLTNYDCLILVEVYRNVCGMSVVGKEFEKLKRFNLSEIYQEPSPEGLLRANEST